MSDSKAQEAGVPPYPEQPQAPYPQQPQAPYPVQPQAPYPQQVTEAAYPPQHGPYASQPQAYPVGQPYTGYDAPPAYDPTGQPGYQTQPNVVMQQPVGAVIVEGPTRRPELGIAATVFAVFVTIFAASFLCLWVLPCTIVGIILGVTAIAYGDRGDLKTAKTHFGVSMGCTIAGVVFAVVGVICIVVGIVVAVSNASSQVSSSSNFNTYN